MSHSFDIVIVGGGLVGAAAALALARQCRSVALVEIRPPATDPGQLRQNWDARIYAVSPANQAFLTELAAWPDESRIQPVSRMDVRGDQSGRIVFSAAESGVARLNSMLENRWLLAALWRRLTEYDIPVFSARAHSLHTDLYAACLTLDDGTQLHSKLLIGADGAQSWVRRQAGIEVRENAYGHHGVVANFATEKAHEGTAFQWFKQPDVLAFLPLPGKMMSMVWSTADAQRLTAMNPHELAETVAAAGQHALGTLEAVSPAFAFELVLRRPHATFAQRVLLMGDAAHTVHPLAGQGVNLGFGDVAEFARLSRHAADPGAHQLLKHYAQNRLEPVRLMQWGCDALFQLFGSQSLPGQAALRNHGLDAVNRLGWLKRRLIRHAMGF